MRTRNKQAKNQSGIKRPKRGADTPDTANDNPKTPSKNEKRKSANNKPEAPKAKKRHNIDVDADNDTSEDKDKRKRCDVSDFSFFCLHLSMSFVNSFLYHIFRVELKASTLTVDQNLSLMIRKIQVSSKRGRFLFMYLRI